MPNAHPWTCGTCKADMPAEAHRNREPGWNPGDYDCDDCYQTWPARADAGLRPAKPAGGDRA